MQSTIPAIDVINERIESLPINRAELARRAGIDGELLRRSLIGERKLVGDELVNICAILNISMDDFIVKDKMPAKSH